KHHGRQLGIAGPARAQLAAHEGNARNAHAAELTRGPTPESVGERGITARPAHPAERDVRRKWPLLARESERRERRVDASGELGHLRRTVGHSRPQDPRPAGRGKRAETPDARLEGTHPEARVAQRAGNRLDARLGHRAQELERQMEVAGHDPRDVTRGGTELLDRLTERSSYDIVQKDGEEGANVRYFGAPRSCRRFRRPCRRSGSGSAASASRRSARAPSWSPFSSFSRPRAASARESSGTGSGARVGGTAAICWDEA